jgi:methanogenic corrinoid protein MtbC1
MDATKKLSPQDVTVLLKSLTFGDHRELEAQINLSLSDSWSFTDITAGLIEPIMIEVGRQWAMGEISIAREHVITGICQQMVSQLRLSLPLPDYAEAPIAIVGSAPNERHSLGAEIVAGTLQVGNWRPIFLGPDTPVEGFLAAVDEWMASMVAISVSTTAAVPAAQDLVSEIKHADPDRRVAVGGQAAVLQAFPEADLVAGTETDLLIESAAIWRQQILRTKHN